MIRFFLGNTKLTIKKFLQIHNYLYLHIFLKKAGFSFCVIMEFIILNQAQQPNQVDHFSSH